MTRTHFIPTNFRIPKGYKRKFIFDQPEFQLVLEAKSPFRLKYICTYRTTTIPFSEELTLDWLFESMEAIRQECEE